MTKRDENQHEKPRKAPGAERLGIADLKKAAGGITIVGSPTGKR